VKLPFKILSRSRWERIRMALDAWPRMLASREEAHRSLELQHDELFAAHQDLATEYRQKTAELEAHRDAQHQRGQRAGTNMGRYPEDFL